MLAALAVVYVGIAGANTSALDTQLAEVAAQAHVQRRKLGPAAVRAIGSRGENSHELVEQLHVDGVIGGELVESSGHLVLHLIIYAGDGHMKSYSEVPLATRSLTKAELETLRGNFDEEVASLAPAARAAPAPLAEIEFDEPARAAAPVPEHVAAPTEVADANAVDASELEALNAVGGGSDTESTALAPEQLHLAVDVGFGVVARSFTPGPATVAAYSSSPVGALALAGRIEPTENLRIGVAYEHTIGMTSGMSPTSIDRWEVAGGYQLATHLRADLGLGHRGFAIDSSNTGRTPDGDYNYAIAALTGALALGRLSLDARLAFEPVLWGAEPTEMSFGSASRWAIEATVAAELRATSHVFLRAAFDYQRFSWTWDKVGGATDGYPSGTLSLGARY